MAGDGGGEPGRGRSSPSHREGKCLWVPSLVRPGPQHPTLLWATETPSPPQSGWAWAAWGRPRGGGWTHQPGRGSGTQPGVGHLGGLSLSCSQ